jgi:hypothetical protein
VFHRFVKRRRTARKTEGAPSVPDADNRWITDGAPSDNFALVTRDNRGRFTNGAIANPTGLFKKGRSGNPAGRPKGPPKPKDGRSRAGARAAAALLDEHAEFVAEQAIELVRERDPISVRYCLGRILGVRRGQPVELALPEIAAPRDLSGAVAAVTAALAEGRLTPDEAHACARMLDGLPRILAAARADAPRQWPDGEDPRKTLARKLARLAKSTEDEALRQSRALAGVPSPPRRLDASVAEQQEEDQHDQQNAADADAAAVAVPRITPAAAPEQQQDQNDQ